MKLAVINSQYIKLITDSKPSENNRISDNTLLSSHNSIDASFCTDFVTASHAHNTQNT